MRSPARAASITPAPSLGLDGAASLVFQPAVDLADGRLLGFEALLRWHDSSGGDIPPDVTVTDGGGNTATGNGNAGQCKNVVCAP